MAEYSVIGKPHPQIGAVSKVCGEADYVGDISLQGMLFGKTLKSPYPHAKIVNINTSKAEKLPGVRAVITGKDTPGIKYGMMHGLVDEYFLPLDKVRSIGEDVAAVAAIDEDIAEEAIELIKVEYEPLPALFDLEEAMKEGAIQLHDHAKNNIALKRVMNFGDVEKGFKESHYVREDRFTTQPVMHGFIEPHATIARWNVEGNLTLWANTQSIFLLRRDISRYFSIPMTKIRVIKPYVGGAFGGKVFLIGANICAIILSQKTAKPVRICHTTHDTFINAQRRSPITHYLKTGVRKDGTLVAQKVKIISDRGPYGNVLPITLYNNFLAHMIPYRLPNINLETYGVYTNNPRAGGMRGHGQIQVRFGLGCQMDMIAEELGIDPIEMRLRNALQTGDVTVNNLKIISSGLSEAIQAAVQRSGWREKRGKLPDGQGIGIGCAGFACGPRIASITDTGAIIKLNEDGGVIVFTGANDIGQGSNTVMALITAEVLGLAPEDVKVVWGDTELTPFDAGSYGSRATFWAGNAAKKAAENLQKQIAEIIAPRLGASPAELVFKDHWIYPENSPEKKISFAEAAKTAQTCEIGRILIGRASYYPRGIEWPDPKNNWAGNIGGSYSFSSQVAEVKVDMETGQVKLVNMTLADDIGYPINSMVVDSQATGSAVTGQGQVLFEDVTPVKGEILNPSYRDYKMPTVLDAPKMEVEHIITNDPEGPFGAKEVGEGFIVSNLPAIVNAIHDATGVWIKDLPVTPEKILRALKEREGGET